MTKFHSDDYIKFLRSIRPDNMSDFNKQMQRCKSMSEKNENFVNSNQAITGKFMNPKILTDLGPLIQISNLLPGENPPRYGIQLFYCLWGYTS